MVIATVQVRMKVLVGGSGEREVELASMVK